MLGATVEFHAVNGCQNHTMNKTKRYVSKEEKMKLQWSMTFQKCDSCGDYFGNEGRFQVTVFANSKSEAVDKAKKITECEYIRDLKCKVVELD